MDIVESIIYIHDFCFEHPSSILQRNGSVFGDILRSIVSFCHSYSNVKGSVIGWLKLCLDSGAVCEARVGLFTVWCVRNMSDRGDLCVTAEGPRLAILGYSGLSFFVR